MELGLAFDFGLAAAQVALTVAVGVVAWRLRSVCMQQGRDTLLLFGLVEKVLGPVSRGSEKAPSEFEVVSPDSVTAEAGSQQDLVESLRGLVNCHTGAPWQTVEVQRWWWMRAARALRGAGKVES